MSVITLKASDDGLTGQILLDGNVVIEFDTSGIIKGSGAESKVLHLNDNTIYENVTIPAGKNAGTFGPVDIADGVEVTVSDGSEWTII